MNGRGGDDFGRFCYQFSGDNGAHMPINEARGGRVEGASLAAIEAI